MISKKNNFSLKEAKNLPILSLNRLINKAKKHLINDEVWQRICKENDVEANIIEYIPTKFGKLDVSAKTDHGIVILNYKLLCDGDFEQNYSYLIHEYSHWFQQCFGKKATQSADDGDYLDNPAEEEGFTNQVEYIAKHDSEEKAEDYVDDLLEYHEVNDKDDKKETLMAKV